MNTRRPPLWPCAISLPAEGRSQAHARAHANIRYPQALVAWGLIAGAVGLGSVQAQTQAPPPPPGVTLRDAASGANTAANASPSTELSTQRHTGQDGAYVRVPGDMAAALLIGPQKRDCPDGLPAQTRCFAAQDPLGGGYWIALPPAWNGTLVVHAHGGPELGKPELKRTADDLKRWSVFVRSGAAWVGSTYRQGGVEVISAGEDTERARQAFIHEFGFPKVTLLHGQSWGASVAARMAERYTTPDVHPRHGTATHPPYDAVLLTSGVLGGAPRAYDVRLDLRVVYQALCNNHPRPTETPYPLWMGQPLTHTAPKLTREDLARRVDDCTGIRQPAAQRSAAQQRALDTLVGVLHLPESSLIGHLNWATWHFHDIVWRKLKGRNPFGNEGVTYAGSPGGATDDATLNQHVARYKADPSALADLNADATPTGRIDLPVLTVHAIDDPVAFVELEDTWRATMTAVGKEAQLLQVYTRDHEHSYLSDAQYIAATDALLDWASSGKKPTAADIAKRCAGLEAKWDPAKGCRWAVDYQPAALSARVAARVR